MQHFVDLFNLHGQTKPWPRSLGGFLSRCVSRASCTDFSRHLVVSEPATFGFGDIGLYQPEQDMVSKQYVIFQIGP